MDLTVKLSYLRFCTCTFSCFRDHNTVDRIDRHVKQFTVFALQCRSNVGHITDVIAVALPEVDETKAVVVDETTVDETEETTEEVTEEISEETTIEEVTESETVAE